jgi:hypothetical protein
MKPSIICLLSISIFLCCCQQPTKTLPQTNNAKKSIIIDSTFCDTVKRHIQLKSDRYFSSFNTPIEARFFSGGVQTDSIIQSDFHMISWYSSNKDTIDLVAHIGELESIAMLVRVVKGQPTVLFFRAPHDVEGSKYFKVAKLDTFTHKIEVTPVRYQLKLSEVPDTLNKQVVYGQIDLESGDYYDKRDTTGQTQKVQMKFYFRSQYRKFDY